VNTFTEKWSTTVDGLVIICKLFSFGCVIEGYNKQEDEGG